MPHHETPSPGERADAPRVSFFTLGCRLNQHDTAAMRSDLERAGWRAGEARSPGDVVVVNTCTVTRRADQESRQLIRRLARERPGARIVVTGCYAQRAPEELRTLPGVSLVLGTAEGERIAALLPPPPEEQDPSPPDRTLQGGAAAISPGRARRAAGAPAPLHFGRAKALLKIQDGCDSFCTYCIVPYVRGRARSLPVASVLDQARRLLDAGFRELVLTGADLGSYGEDQEERPRLISLVEDLLSLGGAHRVRLSSIEPNKVPPEVLDLLGAEPRLCRHLHLPLQSGAASVLRSMRRGYMPRDYAALVERAARRGPVGIGADVIVGFPGEGEAEFEETYDLVRSLPITYLHVFRYSPRPGTMADRRERGVTAAVARERSERLRALGEEKRRRFHASLVGSMLSCLLERGPQRGEGWRASSDLYAPVRGSGAAPPGSLFWARIEASEGETLQGVPASG